MDARGMPDGSAAPPGGVGGAANSGGPRLTQDAAEGDELRFTALGKE